MEICRKCLGLRGTVVDAHGAQRTQRCACEPAEPRWTGYDYNRAVELCRCCGAQTVESGSRWSLFFCAACHAAVVAHNRVDHRRIPIGRHSLMNGVILGEVATLFARIERLNCWHCERVSALLRGIPGAEPRVALENYLAHARAREALGLEDTDDPIECAEQFVERLAAALT